MKQELNYPIGTNVRVIKLGIDNKRFFSKHITLGFHGYISDKNELPRKQRRIINEMEVIFKKMNLKCELITVEFPFGNGNREEHIVQLIPAIIFNQFLIVENQ
jgi:hypothetical protein